MKITKVFSSPDSGISGAIKNTNVSVDEPVEINGRVAYRKTFYLRFPLDEHANGIKLKPDTSDLSSRFSPYTINLSESNSLFQETNWQSEEDDNLVKVRLTHPWRLTKVKTNDSRGIDIFRLDGDALGSEPTIKANANTTISAEFVAKDFAMRKVAVYSYSELSTAIETEMQHQTTKQHAMHEGPMALGSSPGSGASVGPEDFGVEMEDFGIEQVPPHGIRWLRLVSYPTGPRIMLGDVNQPITEESTPASWMMESGEFVQSYVSLNAADTDNFWQQLQTKLDRYIEIVQSESDAPLADLYVPITIESDTPCKFKFTELDIEYSLVKTQWDHWEQEHKDAGKEVVSFSGRTLEEHVLKLNLPLAAQVEKAIVRIDKNIKSPSGFDAGQLDADLNQAMGVMITQGAKAAQCLSIDQATNVNRVAIALMGVDDSVTGTVKLVADQNGQPTGSELATGNFSLNSAKLREWVFVELAANALLDIGSYWLVLTCSEGKLLWLADQTSGKVTVMNGGKSQIQTVKPLSALGHAVDTKSVSVSQNLSLKLNSSIVEFAGTELDLTSMMEDE